MTDDDLWFRRFHPSDNAATQLVCLPHAGGAATYFFEVARTLSPEIDVLAVQYPGRQDRYKEPLVDDVHVLADRLTEALLPLATRPITLFGHSLGASVGFEVALRLEKAGVAPTALFASGRRAPSRHRNDQVHLRDDDGLLAEVRALSGTDSGVLDDEEVLRMVLPALRSDYKAAETYSWREGAGLECPVFGLTGESDPRVTVDEVAAWEAHTSSAFELVVYPGDHFYLNENMPDILRLIRKHVRTPAGTGR